MVTAARRKRRKDAAQRDRQEIANLRTQVETLTGAAMAAHRQAVRASSVSSYHRAADFMRPYPSGTLDRAGELAPRRNIDAARMADVFAGAVPDGADVFANAVNA